MLPFWFWFQLEQTSAFLCLVANACCCACWCGKHQKANIFAHCHCHDLSHARPQCLSLIPAAREQDTSSLALALFVVQVHSLLKLNEEVSLPQTEMIGHCLWWRVQIDLSQKLSSKQNQPVALAWLAKSVAHLLNSKTARQQKIVVNDIVANRKQERTTNTCAACTCSCFIVWKDDIDEATSSSDVCKESFQLLEISRSKHETGFTILPQQLLWTLRLLFQLLFLAVIHLSVQHQTRHQCLLIKASKKWAKRSNLILLLWKLLLCFRASDWQAILLPFPFPGQKKSLLQRPRRLNTRSR